MTEENTQEQSQEQAPFPVAENPYDGAPKVTPAGNPDEAAEASPEEGVAVTMVEDDDGKILENVADDTPSSIQLQPGDAPVEKPKDLSDFKSEHPELTANQAEKLAAEMGAGAARVQEHEERDKLLASKRENPIPEEVQVAEATEANKDL